MLKDAKDFIGKKVKVQIDRPLGSAHPKHGFLYKVNYGFIPKTLSPDGEEIDAYVLGVSVPIKSIVGLCIAVIHRTNDNDDKLVVVPIDYPAISDKGIRTATEFQEKYFDSIIIH